MKKNSLCLFFIILFSAAQIKCDDRPWYVAVALGITVYLSQKAIDYALTDKEKEYLQNANRAAKKYQNAMRQAENASTEQEKNQYLADAKKHYRDQEYWTNEALIYRVKHAPTKGLSELEKHNKKVVVKKAEEQQNRDSLQQVSKLAYKDAQKEESTISGLQRAKAAAHAAG